jgi:hypothetical protein
MIQKLQQSEGHFKVVTIVDRDLDVSNTIQAQVTLKRPRVGEFISGEDWLDRVLKERVLLNAQLSTSVDT